MMDELYNTIGKTTGRHVFCKTLHAGKFLPGNRPFLPTIGNNFRKKC